MERKTTLAKAIQIIKREHSGYNALLYTLESVACDIADGGRPPDAAFFRAALDYISEFLDLYHHPKEDTHLFPALRRRCPEIEPELVKLGAEHEQGPRMVDAMRRALDTYERKGAGAFAAFREALQEYIHYERQHVAREERSILPAASAHLTTEDWTSIDAVFLANDDPLFGERPTQKFRALYRTIIDFAPAPYGFADPGETS